MGLDAPSEPPAPSPAVPEQADDLPTKFRHNTLLAIDATKRVLEIKPDPGSDNYGVELRAVTAASSAQISAQIKIDEAAIVQRRQDDIMEEILRLVAREEARLERQALDLPPRYRGLSRAQKINSSARRTTIHDFHEIKEIENGAYTSETCLWRSECRSYGRNSSRIKIARPRRGGSGALDSRPRAFSIPSNLPGRPGLPKVTGPAMRETSNAHEARTPNVPVAGPVKAPTWKGAHKRTALPGV
jgi:hypothetical protein